jgi:parallel beta-helix repeat protein
MSCERRGRVRAIIDRLGWGIAGASTLALVLVVAGVVRAGPLDPTGPPSSTSGVLRPGTPITSLPYTITSPGSYYLVGNLTGVSGQPGIAINSDDVSLDLSGFTLIGVPGSNSGVRVSPGVYRNGIIVRNGIARGWGESGFQLQFAVGGVFDTLTSESNGLWGFVIGGGSSLMHCAANNNAASGVNAVSATVQGCAANTNGGHGFQINQANVMDCVADYNAFDGVNAAGSSRIDGCHVWENHAHGIIADGSTVTRNTLAYNNDHGIAVLGTGSLVSENTVFGNGLTAASAGIYVSGSNARIDRNHVTDEGVTPSQDVGIQVVGSGNAVINNTAHGNAANYQLTGANGSYGPLAPAESATNPFTNIDY